MKRGLSLKELKKFTIMKNAAQRTSTRSVCFVSERPFSQIFKINDSTTAYLGTSFEVIKPNEQLFNNQELKSDIVSGEAAG